jgi:hypothetical protein
MPACYLITLTPETLLILYGLIVRLVVHDDFATRKDYHKDDEFVCLWKIVWFGMNFVEKEETWKLILSLQGHTAKIHYIS